MAPRDIAGLLKDTAKDWSDDHAARLAAALAYYTLLSIAPLLVIAVSVAGLAFDEHEARGQIAQELGAIVGPKAAESLSAVIENAQAPSKGVIGTIVGVIALMIGASGVFGELQATLNTIWEVEPKPGRGVWGAVKDRFFSFTMVLGVAFLLLVSLVLSTALSAAGHFFSGALPGGEALWQVVNLGLSVGFVTLLFALIFKVVPDVKIGWRDVWPGAFATAILFTIGKFALGLYLGKSSLGSSYGAAGSLVALAAWVYYAAQILFMGAEFTQVYARHRGSRIRPSEDAQPAKDAGGANDASGRRPAEPAPAAGR